MTKETEKRRYLKVTKEELMAKLLAYLNRSITLQALVDWAEKMVQEAEYDEKDYELIKSILAHLGLADVKQFGLTWDDCYDYLSALGYKVRVAVS